MFSVLENSLPIFASLLVGFLSVQRKIVSKEEASTVGTLAFRIVGPFLIFSSLYGLQIDTDQIFLLLGPLVVIVAMILLSFALGKILSLSPARRGALIVSMIVFGAGSAYPFVKSNYSAEVFSNFIVADITQFLLFLIVCPVISVLGSMKSRNGEPLHFGTIIKKVTSDPFIVSMALAVGATYLGIKIPPSIMNIAEFLASSFFVLTSLYIGMILKIPQKSMLATVGAIYVMRVIVAFTVVWVLSAVFSLDKSISIPMHIPFFAQFSVLSVMYAKEYGFDHEFVSQLVLFSMIAQLFIYPLAIAVL